jgi:integrase
MISSNCFTNNKIETISSHSFRVFHAVETYKNESIEFAQKELGHKNKTTTYNSYIKPDLNFKEEKYPLIMNKGEIIDKKNFNNKFAKKKKTSEKNNEVKQKNNESEFS